MAMGMGCSGEPSAGVPDAAAYARLEGLAAGGLAVVPGPEVAAAARELRRFKTAARALELEFIYDLAHRTSLGPDLLARQDGPDDGSVFEVRVALGVSSWVAHAEVGFACEVISRLPALLVAMKSADLPESHARRFATDTGELPTDLARRVVDELLPGAAAMTLPQLRQEIVAMAMALDPEWMARVYAAALAKCNVTGRRNPDGTADITAVHLSPEGAAAAMGRLDSLARAAKADGDPRPIGIVRGLFYLAILDGTYAMLTDSQMLADMKASRPQKGDPGPGCGGRGPGTDGDGPDDNGPDGDGGPGAEGPQPEPEPGSGLTADPGSEEVELLAPSEIADSASPSLRVGRHDAASDRPVALRVSPGMGVHLRVEIATLLNANAHPAELVGMGPVGAATARDTVRAHAGGRWRWAVTDEDGHLLHAGRTRARPHGYRRPGVLSCATIDLLIPATLLARLTDPDRAPDAEGDVLAAWLPVLTDIAAGLAAAAEAPAPDPKRRFPDTALRRRILMGTRTCTGPYCQVPARRTEIDHIHPHARGGPTLEVNLTPECTTEHRLKTKGQIRVQRAGPHTLRWTTRLGVTTTVPVPPVIAARPDPNPTEQPFHDLQGTPTHGDWRDEPLWEPPRPPPRSRPKPRPRWTHTATPHPGAAPARPKPPTTVCLEKPPF